MVTGYCVKCKEKDVEIKDANEVTMKNGRSAMKGECPTCGTGMFRIMGKSKE
jgi:Zn finger protein HypA/HybF involved in hydrogenase expression